MHDSLAAALEGFKPQIAADYEGHVRHLFAKMVEKHGPGLRGIYSCWTFAKTFSNLVQRYVTFTRGLAVELVDEDLAKGANEYAQEVLAAWQAKIERKIGELEQGTVHKMDGVAFRITGTRGGRKVEIDQQMILNWSALGRPFNQFPARIRVDGKATSEAAYKKMFAGAAA